jgi:acyl dehydratase
MQIVDPKGHDGSGIPLHRDVSEARVCGMTLDEYFRIGSTVEIGSYRFTAEAIKAFAQKYDPQPFHLDEELAKKTVFGRLCASGWHTAAAWMRCNVARQSEPWMGDGPAPRFGPSPGMRNLKWPKPVFADETVTFTRTTLEYKARAALPGWLVLKINNAGVDISGDSVLDFDSSVLVEVGRR